MTPDEMLTGYFGVELRHKGMSHWYHTGIHRDLRGEQDVRDVIEKDITQVVDYTMKTLRESDTPEPMPSVSEVISLTFMERIGELLLAKDEDPYPLIVYSAAFLEWADHPFIFIESDWASRALRVQRIEAKSFDEGRRRIIGMIPMDGVEVLKRQGPRRLSALRSSR